MAECITTVVQILTLIIVAITAVLISSQVSAAREQLEQQTSQNAAHFEWEKKRATLDTTISLVAQHFEVTSLENKERFGSDVFDETQTFDSIKESLSEEDKPKFEGRVNLLLNTLETIAVHMKNGILEPQICYDELCLIFIYYNKWAREYILRSQKQDPLVWNNFMEYAAHWEAKEGSGGSSGEEQLQHV